MSRSSGTRKSRSDVTRKSLGDVTRKSRTRGTYVPVYHVS